MNPVLQAVLAALKLASHLLPENLRGVAQFVAGLLGNLQIPASDPRTEKIAKLVADIMTDLDAALDLPDANAQYAARLAIENKFMRAWIELSPGQGV